MKSGMITRQLNPHVASKIIFTLWQPGCRQFPVFQDNRYGIAMGAFILEKDELYFCSIDIYAQSD